jgi:hypothetical protein
MSETVLDTGSLKVTDEAILFRSGAGGEAGEGRIPLAAITRVVKKKLLLPFFWPVLATLAAELFLAFLVLSYSPPMRQPLHECLVGLGQQQGVETAMAFVVDKIYGHQPGGTATAFIVDKFFDSHHLFLISMGFLALALLPVVCALLLRQNRLVLKLTTPSKPAIGALVIKAGRNPEALQDAIARAIGLRQGRGDG